MTNAEQKILRTVALTVRNDRGNFESNTGHALFARDLAAELAWSIPGFDPQEFVILCMPVAWVGTSKSGVWERHADKFAKSA